jgi:hypothetical protein
VFNHTVTVVSVFVRFSCAASTGKRNSNSGTSYTDDDIAMHANEHHLENLMLLITAECAFVKTTFRLAENSFDLIS